MVLLTTTVDTTQSNYSPWVARDSFDVEAVTRAYPSVPGSLIDFANKMQKPVNNFWTTYRQLWSSLLDGENPRAAYQPMAKWVADNPPFAGRAYREWLTWMYKENRLIKGTLRLRGRRVDLRAIEQNLLVVTAGADHITSRPETLPLLELVGSGDVTHLDRPGGHIGLMAGSKARHEIWPDIAEWLGRRSDL
jgi:polyhydroxyalkanoate synthase subunit PhaC